MKGVFQMPRGLSRAAVAQARHFAGANIEAPQSADGKVRADRPMAGDQQYHLRTRPGDLAPHCLLVGDPERAQMIAKRFFNGGSKKVGDHRGLKSFTGMYKGHRMSVVTTAMGEPSLGIVLPEAHASGAEIFVRVGSCGALVEEAKPGHVIIVTAACRLAGASLNWAPLWYPAVADHRVVVALNQAACSLAPDRTYLGFEATTDCFREGQARPGPGGYIPRRLLEQHEELMHLGVKCYSMEAAGLFVRCSTYRPRALMAGAINAVFANRVTNEFDVAGEELAAEIALEAMLLLL